MVEGMSEEIEGNIEMPDVAKEKANGITTNGKIAH
jgi:hypothetical protein